MTDPFGLLTIFGGVGGSGFIHGKGNASIAAGAILYSSEVGYLKRIFGSVATAGGEENCTQTSKGYGVGVGSVWGFFTGTLESFKGPAYNLTIVTPWTTGITFTTNGTDWGFSIGPGKGLGFGYYINESYTLVGNPGNI